MSYYDSTHQASLAATQFVDAKRHGKCRGNGTDDDSKRLDAVAKVAAKYGILFIPVGTYRIASNLSFPTDLTVWFANGAKLLIDAGVIVTFNGPIEAQRHQIFAGPGLVRGTIRNDEVYPEWWGAKGDGVTDDGPEINLAVDYSISQGGHTISFDAVTYRIASSIRGASYVRYVGGGIDATKIKCANDSFSAFVIDKDARRVVISDMTIEAATMTGTTNAAIECDYTTRYAYAKLVGSITSGATTLTVDTTAGFPMPPFTLEIDAEKLLVTDMIGTTLTVTRGYDGTTAASHAANALVKADRGAGFGNGGAEHEYSNLIINWFGYGVRFGNIWWNNTLRNIRFNYCNYSIYNWHNDPVTPVYWGDHGANINNRFERCYSNEPRTAGISVTRLSQATFDTCNFGGRGSDLEAPTKYMQIWSNCFALTFENCNFEYIRVAPGEAGIEIWSSSEVVFDGCTFVSNKGVGPGESYEIRAHEFARVHLRNSRQINKGANMGRILALENSSIGFVDKQAVGATILSTSGAYTRARVYSTSPVYTVAGPKIDLSGSAVKVPILVMPGTAGIVESVTAVYTEASSADPGVQIKVYDQNQPTYIYADYTTEPNKAQWSKVTMFASTTLASGINSSQTTITVASAVGFPLVTPFKIMVDGEIMSVTGVAGNTFTVTRGVDGTTARSHAAGDPVETRLANRILSNAVVVVECPGGKVGAGEVQVFIHYCQDF